MPWTTLPWTTLLLVALAPSDPVPPPPDGLAERLLERLAAQLEKGYAYEGAEGWLVRSLERKQALGDYDELDAAALGSALTADLRAWTADKHFLVAHMPAFAAELEAYAARGGEEGGDDEPPRDDPAEAAVDFGVRRATVVDEAVGLIRLDRIAFSPGTLHAFQEALAEVAESEALVLDLRDNEGGSADTVRLLVSCFFPPGEDVLLGTRSWRPDGTRETVATDGSLAGPRYLERPVVILTSKDTRSATEALAYHLRVLGRAWVVGERTSGGAHAADMVSLGDGFVALLPMGLFTSSKTGTDWEARGVPLDLACPAGEAEERALELARRLLEAGR